jgi:serine phosphatase RsbU (regulator of sigma subunit)
LIPSESAAEGLLFLLGDVSGKGVAASLLIGCQRALAPEALTAACLKELRNFSSGAPKTDDLTLQLPTNASTLPDAHSR